MKKIITTEKKPIKIWLEDIEDGALKQAKNLSNLPFAFKHIAIMPDSHQGYGMPIGGVLATKGVVIPNAVGADIGCGMCAVKTSLTEIDKETLKKIMGEIRKQIPVGFNKHKKAQDEKLMPLFLKNFGDGDNEKLVGNGDDIQGFLLPVIKNEFEKAKYSLGTLGGGNHFIEIQKGSDGHIWIMIHSGSRNLGKQVADHYNKIAKELNAKWYSSVLTEYDLAFLPIVSEEGQNYLIEMNYCVDFALANRKLMMDRIKSIFVKVGEKQVSQLDVSNYDSDKYDFVEDFVNDNCKLANIKFDPIINIAHNYAKMENHFGENVMVHRKGATLASTDTVGIIPGSQGTKSYIVRGLGNPDSFKSCSHGAGRRMGRKEAERTLNLEEEIKNLNDKGVLHAIRGQKDLDEAPGAYKDISEVMENQKDLVEVVVELTPLAVIKG